MTSDNRNNGNGTRPHRCEQCERDYSVTLEEFLTDVASDCTGVEHRYASTFDVSHTGSTIELRAAGILIRIGKDEALSLVRTVLDHIEASDENEDGDEDDEEDAT